MQIIKWNVTASEFPNMSYTTVEHETKTFIRTHPKCGESIEWSWQSYNGKIFYMSKEYENELEKIYQNELKRIDREKKLNRII